MSDEPPFGGVLLAGLEEVRRWSAGEPTDCVVTKVAKPVVRTRRLTTKRRVDRAVRRLVRLYRQEVVYVWDGMTYRVPCHKFARYSPGFAALLAAEARFLTRHPGGSSS